MLSRLVGTLVVLIIALSERAPARTQAPPLAVATAADSALLPPAHVAYAAFAFDDGGAVARREVLLFLAGILAAVGASATVEALRTWTGGR